MSPSFPTSANLPGDLVETSWLHLCGTLPSSDVDTPIKFFYWEFFSDVALVASPAAMAPLLLQPLGFVEFALIYFALVNGWLLYIHHFRSRFQEHSRMHALLQWIFVLSLYGGVWNCARLADSGDLAERDVTMLYQQFSVCMGFVRLAVLVMFARVAVHVWRAASFCILVTFFLANSFMCFTLAAISDRKSIIILWSIGALIESLLDFFLALCLSRRLYIPAAMPFTMDRFWAVVLAPLGSISVFIFLYNLSLNEDDAFCLVFRGSAVTLLALFGLLYHNLKYAVSDRLRRCHRFLQTLCLLHMKLLGLSLWTVGGNLWILIHLSTATDIRVKDIRHHADLLALNVVFTLILFFAWKSCNERPYELGEIIWIFLINGSFAFGTMLPLQDTHLNLLMLDVVLLAVLNLVECWTRFHERGQELANRWLDSITATVLPSTSTTSDGGSPVESLERQELLRLNEVESVSARSYYSSISWARNP